MKHSIRAALIALPLALVACPGSLEDPDRFAAQFGICPADMPAFIADRCATSGCHTAASPAAGLDLESADIVSRLSGKAGGGGDLLIDPDAPEQSLLYTKVTDSPPSGGRMPLAAEALDDTLMACILTFIE